MLDQANRTFICSVVFVDLVGYSKKSVAEQISVKDRFTDLLSDSLKDIPINERIVLDTGDGAAMSFLGDPEDALFVAMNLRDSLKNAMSESAGAAGRDDDEGLICIGINLGPVKLVKDINGHPNIIGDGINVAQRIMSFAKPGQVVVSRSYYDVVSCLSDEYARLFQFEGSRTDKHVREHEIYVVGKSESAFKAAKVGMETRAARTNPRLRADPTVVGMNTDALGFADQVVALPKGFFADSKKVAKATGILGAVVLLLAILLSVKRPAQPPAKVVQPPAPTVQAQNEAPKIEPGMADLPQQSPTGQTVPAHPVPPPEPTVPSGSTSPVKTTPEAQRFVNGKDAVKTEPVKPEVPPATVALSISPWGEVFVNGKLRGVSPPLKNLKLSPGKYKIEVRNTTFARHVETLEIKSRDEVTVRHKFQ